MSVAIIIPVWNLWESMTLPCLMSLAKYSRDQDIHVYLIDNGSTDSTGTHASAILEAFFGIRGTYFSFSENMGFAIACNRGARLALADGHEFLFFLNNDTILTKNWLFPLLSALSDEGMGAVAPLLLYPQDDKVQHMGIAILPMHKVKHLYHHFPASHHLVHKKRDVNLITGAALLCRTRDFFELGLFHEGYKNGCEDLDFCFTLRQRGLKLCVVTESVVYHHESKSAGRFDHSSANGRLLLDRWIKSFVPDVQFHEIADGYLPAMSPELIYYTCLPEKRTAFFNKKMGGNFHKDTCISMLEREPYWHEGYYLLAKHYENIKEYKTAFSWLHLASKLFPNDLGVFNKMIPLCQHLEIDSHPLDALIIDNNKLEKDPTLAGALTENLRRTILK